jgi:hypothetical protein
MIKYLESNIGYTLPCIINYDIVEILFVAFIMLVLSMKVIFLSSEMKKTNPTILVFHIDVYERLQRRS